MRNDPAVGTWQLDTSRSKFSAHSARSQSVITYEPYDDGVRRVGQHEFADGTSCTMNYTARFDGKEHQVTGSSVIDGIALERVDARTVRGTFKMGGVEVGTFTRVVSGDGKTMTVMTVTLKGNHQGRHFDNVLEFHKLEGDASSYAS
jgi:hypothetical protein